jgi:lysophospholipase L1-like esterase
MIGIGIRIGGRRGGGAAAPVIVSAVIENAAPTVVVLTFDNTVTGVVKEDFTLTGKTISDCTIVDAVVNLTVSVAYAYGDIVTVDYVKDAGNLESFSDLVVTNNVEAVEITAGLLLKYYANDIDAGYITGTDLSGINDLSGNTKHGTAAGIGYPQYIANGLGTNKVIRLGGNNTSYFTFTELTNIKSFIWIGKETTAVSGALSPLFGNTNMSYDNNARNSTTSRGVFERDGTYPWYCKKLRINGVCKNAHMNVVPTSVSIVAGSSTVATRANNLGMDRVVSRIFGGDVLLLKFFSTELTEKQLLSEITYWSNQLSISISYEGLKGSTLFVGDSISYGLSHYGIAQTKLSAQIKYPISKFEETGVGGATSQGIIDLSDANSLPLEKTDIFCHVGINDCHAYYTQSEATQRANFAANLASIYTKLKAKQGFNHVFIGLVGDIYEANVTLPDNQAWIDAIPYHYIYNEEITAFAAAHPTDVHLVNSRTVMNGTTAANYSADGLHLSGTGYNALMDLYVASVLTVYT